MMSFTPSRRRVRYVVGIDIGGTNIVAGTVAEDGSEVLGLVSEPTLPEQGAEGVLSRIMKLARASMAAARGKEIAGLGIGSPGPLDTTTGVVLLTPNLGWVNFPLRDRRPREDHRADRVRGGARRRRVRARGGARHGEVPRGRRGERRQHLQPGGRGHLRRGDARRRQAVPAAPKRGEAPRLQARRRGLPHRAGRTHRDGGRVRSRRRLHAAHLGGGVKRLGVVGSLVWDTIYGRDPAQPAVEEWGGISYSLAALDATLADDWVIVPMVKVGRDLAPRANQFLRTLRHLTPGARFIEVPEPNNRVTLRYYQLERRCEQMVGGVPP